ncbi:PilN domain-containing protein [Ilyobacter polytropus]|uniref:Fimbrial assembly family protein n=1 Tax=Ilyobacter polytropus (strain ATCC 51220 / DSM 2926 / LMG 16218 / CuHBu1) TaxID=572544 RepID=E3H9R5_ILYPC|nr:fimbrial assembly family protein [Ilyobacter polytropus]ADO83594.1 Fimbrial assembly family protein [Ilyobacter polytropus DSM 2926]
MNMNMRDINFLTPEYKEKLGVSQNLKKAVLIAGVFFLINGAIFFGIHMKQKNLEKNIHETKREIAFNQEEIKKLEVEIGKIPDLTDKIEIIEEIFSDKKTRISEVLYTIQTLAPENIWVDTMHHEGGNVRIKGISYLNSEMTPEQNLYDFEDKLIESGDFSQVKHDYLKIEERDGNKVMAFEFSLVISDEEE